MDIKTIKLSETEEYKNLPNRLKWAIDDIINYGEEHRKIIKDYTSQIEGLQNFIPAQKFKEYNKYPEVWKNGSYYHPENAYPILTVEQLKESLDAQGKI